MAYDPHFYDVLAQGCRSSAAVVVPVLCELFCPGSVVDVGCGEGHWLAEFKRLGCTVVGIDGDYVRRDRLVINQSEFRPADIANLPSEVNRYDLAISLEVAEHLPAEAAERYVAYLVASAPIVAFSAAIPGQGGVGHLNEQWPSYWQAIFARHGYVASDALRWRFWNDVRVENWYRQNLLVLASSEAISTLSSPAAELFGRTDDVICSVVHPVLWDSRR